MTLRIYLLSLVAALFFGCSFADTSISLTPQPTGCNKACIQPAVQPQCPTMCPNNCTFVVQDPCCPEVKTGVCDDSPSSGAGTSTPMTAAPTGTGAASFSNAASSLPTTAPSVVTSMFPSSASSSNVASATQTTPSVSSSSRLSSDIIETKYALLAVMFAVLALF
jgi:hypothetical protein